MLKYSLIVVIAAVIGYTALTVYGEVTKTEAARMSASMLLAENQAENMSRALGDVGALAAGDTESTDSGTISPVRLVNEATSFIRGFGVATVLAAEDADTEDSAAIPQPQIGEVGEVANIDILLAHWSPRYADAKLSYVKFETAVEMAKASAASYFAVQNELTEQISAPDRQEQERANDQRDRTLYLMWEAQADSTLSKAKAIGMQLDDMNISLEKLKLRTDFAFDATAFQEVPAAILELNDDLSEFQAASEAIRAATDSPFEAK
ncbi:MAG: hypothetical protein F4X64_05040 [Chloroflexi bacterium]|nr:hypothetical protein [Chloroflexota bacterium]